MSRISGIIMTRSDGSQYWKISDGREMEVESETEAFLATVRPWELLQVEVRELLNQRVPALDGLKCLPYSDESEGQVVTPNSPR